MRHALFLPFSSSSSSSSLSRFAHLVLRHSAKLAIEGLNGLISHTLKEFVFNHSCRPATQ
jgi:hypothetical protein